jgi:D-alanine-D-alanine ligase-like ATP-grasp enzyme
MDLIIHKDNIYFLETNTAPGLMMNHLNNKVANSYLGIMAEKEGINLIEEIVKIAKKRYNL